LAEYVGRGLHSQVRVGKGVPEIVAARVVEDHRRQEHQVAAWRNLPRARRGQGKAGGGAGGGGEFCEAVLEDFVSRDVTLQNFPRCLSCRTA